MIQWRWKLATVAVCLAVTAGGVGFTASRLSRVASADCTRDANTTVALRRIISQPNVARHVNAERALRELPVPSC